MPPVPPGRAETIFKRPALFHGKVRHRKAQLRSGTAWPVAASESCRLRLAVTRKEEDEAHLRSAGAPVPPLLRARHADKGSQRGKPDHHAGAPFGQRVMARRLGVVSRAG